MERKRRRWLLVAVTVSLAGFLGCIEPKQEVTPARGDDLTPPASAPQEVQERRVIHSSLAGSWYEEDPVRLREEIRSYLEEVDAPAGDAVTALILPHAGYRWSGATAAHGIRQVSGRTFKRVIVLGPSHRVPMENMASLPLATHYATPLGEVPLDTEFLGTLRKHPFFGNIPRVHEHEHSVQIEVPLLQEALGPFRLVPIVVGELDPKTARAMARVLLGLIDEETLVVVSSDFTHYGPNYRYVPFEDDLAENLEKLDMEAFAALKGGDAEVFRSFLAKTGDTICGREPVELLLEMLPATAELQLLKYDTSGRISGDFSNSVSYLSIGIRGAWAKSAPVAAEARHPLGEEDRRRLLDLARKTLKHCLDEGEAPGLEELGIEATAAMRVPRAAFVTLKKRGRLRGCIGGTYPSRPLYREVMAQVVNAAFRDGRFSPVKASEFPELHIEISALTPPRRVDSHEEIVIGRDGIILDKGGRRAVYLPQVAPEQGWDLTETLGHLSNKAGLSADAWKEGATFLVFQAEIFAEPEE